MLNIFGGTLLIATFLATSVVSAAEIQATTYDGLAENCGASTPPEKFFKIGTKYYTIELVNKVNWFEAAHICRAQNAQLANIATEEEMLALSNYLVSTGHIDKYFWLSGNDLGNEGSFVSLATGRPLSYSRWSPGQPDNAHGKEHCMHLWKHANAFYMNDCPCPLKMFYICQTNEPKTVVLTVW